MGSIELAKTATAAVAARPTTADWVVATKGLERAVKKLDSVPMGIGSIFNRTIPDADATTIRASIDDALLGVEIALQRLTDNGAARPDAHTVVHQAKQARTYLQRLDDRVVAGKAGEGYRNDLYSAREYSNKTLTAARHEMRSSEHRQVGEHVAKQVEEVFAELDRMGMDTAVPKELQVQNAVDGMLARGVIEA